MMKLHSDFVNTKLPRKYKRNNDAPTPESEKFEPPKFGTVRKSNRKVVFIYDSTADKDSLHQILNFMKSFILFTQNSGIEIGIIPWAKEIKPSNPKLEKNTIEFRTKIFDNMIPIPNPPVPEYKVAIVLEMAIKMINPSGAEEPVGGEIIFVDGPLGLFRTGDGIDRARIAPLVSKENFIQIHRMVIGQGSRSRKNFNINSNFVIQDGLVAWIGFMSFAVTLEAKNLFR